MDTNTQNISQSDWVLGSIVNAANYSGLEMPITLLSHGFLISGILIGGGKYFEGISTEFSDMDDEVKSEFVEIGEKIYPESVDNRPPTVFIHLKNAKYFNTNGKPIPGDKGMWWRGRLVEISGFNFGSLSID